MNIPSPRHLGAAAIGPGGISPAPAALLVDVTNCAAAVLAARALRRTCQPYALAFEGRHPYELQAVADRLGLDLKLISIPPETIGPDFIHLATQHRCTRPGEYVLGFVTLHACEVVPEAEIWLPLDGSRGAWQTAVRIARHHGKTIFNPLKNSNSNHPIGRRQRSSAVVKE